MSKVKIQGNASGTGVLTVTAPNTSTDRTITLPDSTDTLAVNSDVTNKLPLAGGTLTGDVNMLKTSGNSEFKVEASGTDAYATVRVKNDAKDYSMQIRSDQSDAWTIRDETAGANRLLISSTGDVTLGTGDLIFGTAGKGIVLGSTSNTDANTLDDYEEGTWSPNVGGNASYTTQNGTYVKVGKMCTASCEMQINAIGNAGSYGTLQQVRGLPFTAIASPTLASSAAVGYASGLSSSFIALTFRVDNNSTNVLTTSMVSAATTSRTSENLWTSGSRVLFSITYVTA